MLLKQKNLLSLYVKCQFFQCFFVNKTHFLATHFNFVFIVLVHFIVVVPQMLRHLLNLKKLQLCYKVVNHFYVKL